MEILSNPGVAVNVIVKGFVASLQIENLMKWNVDEDVLEEFDCVDDFIARCSGA